MKRFLLKLSLLTLSVIFPFCLILGYMVSYPDNFNGTIAGSMRYKTNLLKNADEGVVIFAGGSSSPYGINCSEFKNLTGKEAINIGSTAYLGIDFYLSVIERYAKPGDDIILGFEWFLYTGENINYTLMWEAIGHSYDVFKCVPLSYYRGLFSSIKDYYYLKRDNPVDCPTLLPSGWGEAGDVVFHRESILEKGYNTDDMSDIDVSKIDPLIIQHVNCFIKKMENKGCRVFIAFAPLNCLAVVSSTKQNREFEMSLQTNIHTDFLNTLDDALMDGEFFYDSNNHLTSFGSELYTESIAKNYMEFYCE